MIRAVYQGPVRGQTRQRWPAIEPGSSRLDFFRVLPPPMAHMAAMAHGASRVLRVLPATRERQAAMVLAAALRQLMAEPAELEVQVGWASPEPLELRAATAATLGSLSGIFQILPPAIMSFQRLGAAEGLAATVDREEREVQGEQEGPADQEPVAPVIREG